MVLEKDRFIWRAGTHGILQQWVWIGCEIRLHQLDPIDKDKDNMEFIKGGRLLHFIIYVSVNLCLIVYFQGVSYFSVITIDECLWQWNNYINMTVKNYFTLLDIYYLRTYFNLGRTRSLSPLPPATSDIILSLTSTRVEIIFSEPPILKSWVLRPCNPD